LENSNEETLDRHRWVGSIGSSRFGCGYGRQSAAACTASSDLQLERLLHRRQHWRSVEFWLEQHFKSGAVGSVRWLPPMGFSNSASGVIGGGQIGYNWQFNGNWLLGVETDFQGANLQSGSTVSPVPLSPTAGGGFALNSSEFMNRELNWFGTVRGRLGLTFDRLLIYGTGGGRIWPGEGVGEQYLLREHYP